jgi:hypothetical protein
VITVVRDDVDLRSGTSWEWVLDDLEERVVGVEAMLAEHVAPSAQPTDDPGWEPPTELGPLPAGLQARAAELLLRQEKALARLADAIVGVRGELGLLTTMANDRASAGPSFLDVGL